MKLELVKQIKDLENKFLRENTTMYINSRVKFLRKREEFVSQKLDELKNGKSCEESSISGDNS